MCRWASRNVTIIGMTTNIFPAMMMCQREPVPSSRSSATPRGKRPDRLVGGHDQRPEIVVPVVDHAEKGKAIMVGMGDGDHDPEDDLQDVRPVDPRRIQDVVADAVERLTDEECSKRGGGVGQDERPVRIEQAHLSQHDVYGDEADLRRDHEAGDHQKEAEVPPGELKLAERVCRQAPRKSWMARIPKVVMMLLTR